jgi:hypothetical protein
MPMLIVRKTSQRFAALVTAYALLASLAPIGVIAPSQAMPLSPAATMQPSERTDIVPARVVVHGGRAVVGPRGGAVVRRGGAVVGPRGGAAYRRTAVVGPRGNVAVVRRGGWARPGWYRWPVGGAIAAGAALGFVAAAAATAYAVAPAPAPGMCWYYTDMSRTQGFWDYCPQ